MTDPLRICAGGLDTPEVAVSCDIISTTWRCTRRLRASMPSTAEAFDPARALHARHGFTTCDAFGNETDDPFSVFMTRTR